MQLPIRFCSDDCVILVTCNLVDDIIKYAVNDQSKIVTFFLDVR